jgi:type I restriction enzyme, R subunit
MEHKTPFSSEDAISQVPALHLLQNLGYTYLTPEEALELRGGRASGVILDGILENQLRRINKIQYKGNEYPFAEGNILSAIQALKDVSYDGLIRTNEKIYDLICLGKSLQQSISGDIKSFTLKYIDWEDPKNNVYHVTEEFVVERTGSHDTRRPDIVLFVNGIPLCIIECKKPSLKDPIAEAISQQIRNQKDHEIPRLFIYSQLLLALSKNEAKYATTGTSASFWAIWKENKNIDDGIKKLANKPLALEESEKLFQNRKMELREQVESFRSEGREVTPQDRMLYSLCRPGRLLEMTFRYILYDAGEKKIARYQQYFCVSEILDRITKIGRDGKRKGGVVWHTQGSGKSLTMVMLAKGIAIEPGIDNYRIILVTDRVDLDDQLYKTFDHCGKEVEQSKTGKHLIEMLKGHKQRIITTLIHKFEAAVKSKEAHNTSHNIFVLVDESHRTNTGLLHAKMRLTLPNACYIGFTGTPVMKKDRNTVVRFGGLIDTYTITRAVQDKAVVPLLYEGRHAAQEVDSKSIDSWFDRITTELSKEQVADLKKKFATTDQLNKAEQKVMRIAWDISEHFRDNWQGTPFKGQLVTQDKAAGLLYKKYLDEFGFVSSEYLISGPDDREGEEDIYKENKQAVIVFWKAMMDKYGNEKEYNRQIINTFKHGEYPEIIIVVDKLLTGFDAPKNTVLYLTRKLKDHTLLQAIARVNRLYEGKDFGYIIDYRGVLENLDQALDIYGALPEFAKEDLDDLKNTLVDVNEHIKSLPQKHSVLWDIFNKVKNSRDEEAYERLLSDEALRIKFYDRFSDFARALGVGLASVRFLEKTPQKKIDIYKKDLKFFDNLRKSVRRRYAEVVDFSEYEPKIQKLLDTHVSTHKIEKITPLVNIFDADAFSKEVEKLPNAAAKADTIAHRTKRTISERMQEDPVFYRKFSEMLEAAIQAFREKRIQAAEYLRKVTEIRESIVNRSTDDIPDSLKQNDVAQAFYRSINEILKETVEEDIDFENISSDAALGIDEIIHKNKIVNWTINIDVQNRMKNKIEDFLFELKDRNEFELSFDDVDKIMDECLEIAKVKYP